MHACVHFLKSLCFSLCVLNVFDRPCLCLIPYTSCGDLVLCRWFPSAWHLSLPSPRPSNPPSSSFFFRLNTSRAPSLFLSFFLPNTSQFSPPSPSSWLSRCLSLSLLFLFLFPSLSPPSLFISLLSFFRLILFKQDIKYCQIMLLIFFSAATRWRSRSCAGSNAKTKDPPRQSCCNHFKMQVPIR